jgi:hypothetical protein
MTFVIREERKNFKPVPAGTHAAICVSIVNMGIQNDSKFGPRRKIYFRWELPGEQTSWRDKQGNEHHGPMTIGKSYTYSLNEKSTLCQDLESWRGKLFTDAERKAGVDVSDFLGKSCILGIVHKGSGDKVFADVKTVMGAPPSVKLRASGTLIAYDADDHDPELFALLPSWLQQKISDRIVAPAKVEKAQPSQTAADVGVEFDDEIPFGDDAPASA